jgi:LysM repeat protein
MKMPTLPKMPRLPKLPRLPKPQQKRLQASARRAAQPAFEDYDEEPTTRLSSAFVVVLILHVVAIGGIYAFNSIKAHRRGPEPSPKPAVANADKASLRVPSTVEAPPADRANQTKAALAESASAKVAPVSGSRIHHVRSGDSLSKLALQYGTSVEDFQELNKLKSPTDIRPGQALNIPAPSKPSESRRVALNEPRASTPEVRKTATPVKASQATPAGQLTYTVKKGDNPVLIARKFKVSYDDLLKLNKIDDPRKLRIDQELKIPAKKKN